MTYFAQAETRVLKAQKSKLSRITKIEVVRLVNKKDKRNCFMVMTPLIYSDQVNSSTRLIHCLTKN